MTDKRNAQRERLLQAAFDLVTEVGVSGLRTRDIAERAGVNIATLHYCFEGKDALLAALYEFVRDRFKAEFGPMFEEAATPAEKLTAHAELRIRLLREEPASLRAWRALMGEAWTNPAIREIVRRHQAEQRDRMASLIREGRESGALRNLPTGDDRLAASMAMALFDGMLFQYATDQDAFDLADYSQAMFAWMGMS